VFAIGVPRARLGAEAILQGAPARTHFDLHGRLALLVHEGSLATQSELERLLRGWHCEVIAADAGQVHGLLEGLRRLPDLIIVAQPAGGANGAPLVEMLRNEFNAAVPALLVESGVAPARLRTLINNLLQAPVSRARRVG